jgi:hypothetical protein
MSKDNMFPDLKIDEIPCDTIGVGDPDKKKRVNGNRKGKNFERDICKELGKRFGGEFRRVPMSGGFFGGMNHFKNKEVNEAAKDVLTGDIITPKDFPFVIECKNYFDTPKIHNLPGIGDATLDKWIEQARLESTTANKPWIIIFKVTEYRGNKYIAVDAPTLISHTKGKIHKSIYYNDAFIFDYDYFMDNLVNLYFSKTTTHPLINTNSTTGV